jgi:hypothetical protein
VSVPNQYLEVNRAYTFIVVVTAGSYSSNASVTVTKVGNAIPTVTPLVAHANTFKPSANFITLRVSASICTSESLSYKWRQTSGTQVSLTDVVLTLSSITLPASAFPSESTYEFTVDVTSSTANTSVSFTVTVVYDALIAVIADGDRVVGASSTFTLDGSKSRDPSNTAEAQHYAWSCILENFSACPAALNTLLSQGTTTSIITVALSLPVDTYKFTLVYSKGARTASTTVTIRVVNYSPPSVSVSALPPIIRASSKVSIVGQYDSTAGAATVAWSIIGGDSSLLSEKNLLSKPGDAVLVIKPNVLIPGTTYTFRLTVTNSNGDGYAQTSTMVNTAPVHGTISSNPSSGTALSDFTLTSTSWTSAQAPLSYYFSIKNGESEVRLTKVSSLNTASVTLPQSVSGNTVQVFAHVTVDPTELRIVEQAYNMYDATQIVSSVVSVSSTSSATFTLNLTLSGDYSGISSSRGTYGQCVQWINNAWTPACYAVQISGSVATCSCNGVGEYAVQSVRSTSPPVPAPTLSTGGIVAIAVVSALGVIAAAALFTGSIIACICIYQRKVRNADKERLELTNFSVRSDKYRHDETPATPELELQPMVHRQETFNSVYSTPATPSSPSRMYSSNTPTRNSPSTPTQRSYSPFRQQNSYSRSPREESQQLSREQGLLLDVNRPYTPDRRSQGYGGGSPASQTPSPRNRNSYSPVSFLNNND